MTVSIACLQMNSGPDVAENLAFVESSLAASDGLDILLLPENFAQMPARRSDQYIESPQSGEVQSGLSRMAEDHQVVIIAGSVPIQTADSEKPYARSLVFDRRGKQVGYYDKLHLFDVETGAGSDSRYRESATYCHGAVGPESKQPVSLDFGAFDLQLGLTICYDLRFPELYRALAANQAQLICVPSAFTFETGQAHWEPLLRARAIENQVFIAAAAQTGEHANGRKTWGHSMIIDPWGNILAEKKDGQGLVFADIDLTQIESLRTRFPVHSHKRL